MARANASATLAFDLLRARNSPASSARTRRPYFPRTHYREKKSHNLICLAALRCPRPGLRASRATNSKDFTSAAINGVFPRARQRWQTLRERLEGFHGFRGRCSIIRGDPDGPGHVRAARGITLSSARSDGTFFFTVSERGESTRNAYIFCAVDPASSVTV